jgi:serine phosphatase RsbU (regulator of sigma subunit)
MEMNKSTLLKYAAEFTSESDKLHEEIVDFCKNQVQVNQSLEALVHTFHKEKQSVASLITIVFDESLTASI